MSTVTARKVNRPLLIGGNAGTFTSSYAVTKKDNWVARSNKRPVVITRRKSF